MIYVLDPILIRDRITGNASEQTVDTDEGAV